MSEAAPETPAPAPEAINPAPASPAAASSPSAAASDGAPPASDPPAEPAKGAKGAKGKAADPAPTDGAGDPAPDPAQEPAPEPVAYAFVPDEAVKHLFKADDPVAGAAVKAMETLGLTAEQVAVVGKVINSVAAQLLEGGAVEVYDYQAEIGSLDNGEQRFNAALADIEARKVRGDFTEQEAKELGSIVATGAGLSAFEKLVKAAGPVPVPGDDPVPQKTGKERFDELVRDPRYGKDRKFTTLADREISTLKL